jgi:hypothetical protein
MGNRHLYLQPADAETRLDRDLWHRIATSNAPAGLKALAATVGAAGSDERVPVTVPLVLVDEFRQWHTRLANRRGREEQAIWDAMGRPNEPQRCMNAGNTPAYVRRYYAGQ